MWNQFMKVFVIPVISVITKLQQKEKTAPPGEKRPLCTSSSNQGAMGDVCQEAISPVPPGGENSTILGTIGGMSQQQNLTSNLGGLSAKSHNVSRIEKT